MAHSCPPRESRLGSAITYVLLSATASVLWVYFFLLNRTTVVKPRGLEIRPNTLFVSNHQSSLDSYLIAITALYPRCLLRPWMMPWNLAALEHFYRTPLRAWLSNHLRCIPARTGAERGWALRRLIASLEGGVAIFYPEGKRSQDGAVQAARPGIGFVIVTARPRVIPVAIEGMREAVRFDRFGLRFFRRIGISFGEPFQLGGIPRGEAGRATDETMRRIRGLHAELKASVHQA